MRSVAAIVVLGATALQPMHAAAPASVAAATTSAASRPSTARPGVQVLPRPFAMRGLGRERTLRLYLPPSYASRPDRRYPVIYMHDGQNLFDDATAFAGEWGVDEAMDELARTRGFEAIVVGIDNGGEERVHELALWPNPRHGAAQREQYMAFVVETVKPWIDRHCRTQPGPGATAIIGSSMGGPISHYALLRYPRAFGKAGIFSPAYWFSDEIYTQTTAHPWPAGTRTYFYVGGREREESVPDVERMMTLLSKQAHAPQDVALRVEPEAGHNERAWRAEFPRAVSWLFALPADGAAAGRAAPAPPASGVLDGGPPTRSWKAKPEPAWSASASIESGCAAVVTWFPSAR